MDEMPKKVLVDRDFLMRVLKRVDDLSDKVKTLEEQPIKAITFEDFCGMYNKMVEKNLNALGINIIPLEQPPRTL